MQPDYDQFFASYVAAYNRSLGEAVDVDGIRAHFAESFIAAGPTGAFCGRNDDTFVETLQSGYEFYRSIGTKQMTVSQLQVTPIDDRHDMVKVFYHADYEKAGRPLAIDFDVTYLLQTVDGQTTIFAFVAGDEMVLYRELGLIE